MFARGPPASPCGKVSDPGAILEFSPWLSRNFAVIAKAEVSLCSHQLSQLSNYRAKRIAAEANPVSQPTSVARSSHFRFQNDTSVLSQGSQGAHAEWTKADRKRKSNYRPASLHLRWLTCTPVSRIKGKIASSRAHWSEPRRMGPTWEGSGECIHWIAELTSHTREKGCGGSQELIDPGQWQKCLTCEA
jgi:hypothetical protein